MRGGPGSRPPSAQRPRSSASSAGRPRSRAQSAAPTRQATPLSRQATTNRTSSAQPSWRSSLEKTELQKRIDGDTGPAMIGVSTYPYSRAQSSYREDFEQLVASTITHPYISTTNMSQGSCPHNLLTGAPGLPRSPTQTYRPHKSRRRRLGAGTNFAPTFDYWDSDYKRHFKALSYKKAFNAQGRVRSGPAPACDSSSPRQRWLHRLCLQPRAPKTAGVAWGTQWPCPPSTGRLRVQGPLGHPRCFAPPVQGDGAPLRGDALRRLSRRGKARQEHWRWRRRKWWREGWHSRVAHDLALACGGLLSGSGLSKRRRE